MSNEVDPIDQLEVAKDLVRTDRTDLSWQRFGNCVGMNPDLFFPERGASTHAAKEACRACVVREECGEYALNNPGFDTKRGIWGGTSERERRKLRMQRALARATHVIDDRLE